MEDQWKSFDIDILRVGLIVSNQSSFYRFTNGFAGSKS